MLYLKVLEATRADYLFALKVARYSDKKFDTRYYECKLKSVDERIAQLKAEVRRLEGKPNLRLVKG